MRCFLKPAVLFVALGFSVALIGCDELSEFARDVIYAGTNVGYQRCIERNQNVGVSASIVKSQCLDKHNRTISILHYLAEAGYEKSNSGAVIFSGWIENESKDKIITQFEITVSHQDNINQSGQRVRETHNVRDLWVEPGERATFTISDLKFVPKEGRLGEGWKLGKFRLEGERVATIYLVSYSESKCTGERIQLDSGTVVTRCTEHDATDMKGMVETEEPPNGWGKVEFDTNKGKDLPYTWTIINAKGLQMKLR